MSRDGVFHTILTKHNGKLTYPNGDGELFKEFEKRLSEGARVDVFFEQLGDNYTLSQIAKVHKCIRVLAASTGQTFAEMKLEVKRQAGLCFEKTIEGERFLVIRSFADCSSEEITLAIEAAIEIGDLVGCNVRV